MAETAEPILNIDGSRLFTRWLEQERVSLAFTTYQASKIFFIGLKSDGSMSVFERTFDRCMGIAQREQTLWLAARFQLWRFANIVEAGQTHEGHDALYVPMAGHTTGDVDIHDIAIMPDERPVFVVTLFNCVATLGINESFIPIWKPPFISKLVAEDRCHVNGLALDQGRPRYVTMVSRTDVVEGWREHRVGGGLVMDMWSNEVVCTGLSMPHSPRVHKGKLWLLNAGTGEVGYIDHTNQRFEPVAFCPGFLRGLSMVGDYAVVGLSKPRENRSFNGLPFNDRLEREQVAPRCGIQVIDLKTGAATHSLSIEGFVDELYDVVAIPGVRQPMALGFRTREIHHFLKVGEMNHGRNPF
ncbi:MAG: TIGR03032 family protein [Magnetococcales bacterium]|nr:TIGR03032 family protein [Magnetococcales bacterium]MBF0438470.1 TIGR03032 family protein [Magnetococcales bacterium]